MSLRPGLDWTEQKLNQLSLPKKENRAQARSIKGGYGGRGVG